MFSQRQLFLNHVAQTSDKPMALEIERAEGVHLFDTEGKRYTDLISGISVSNLGHGHPKVVQAVKDQVDRHMHVMVYGEYVQSPQVQLAQALAERLPAPLESTYFVNSGSEAIEGALKLAKRYTGRSEVVSAKNAYHGSTHGALSVMGNEEFKNSFRPLVPGVRQVRFNNMEDLQYISERTACVLLETVQGEAGVIVPDEGYLQAVRQRCSEVGALFILDEIQCGFGRSGTLFAFEQHDVIPDIVCMAKGMGGGMPIGAFVSSKDIMRAFMSDPVLGHITTFGGHPVCSAAALACLQAIEEEQLCETVPERSRAIVDQLEHPAIKQVRAAGLLIAVDLGTADLDHRVIDRCIENGVIVDWFLFNEQSLRIAPPLTISMEQIGESVGIIRQAIEAEA